MNLLGFRLFLQAIQDLPKCLCCAQAKPRPDFDDRFPPTISWKNGGNETSTPTKSTVALMGGMLIAIPNGITGKRLPTPLRVGVAAKSYTAATTRFVVLVTQSNKTEEAL